MSPCERELISIVEVIKKALDGFLLLPHVECDFEMIPKYFSNVLTYNRCIFRVSWNDWPLGNQVDKPANNMNHFVYCLKTIGLTSIKLIKIVGSYLSSQKIQSPLLIMSPIPGKQFLWRRLELLQSLKIKIQRITWIKISLRDLIFLVSLFNLLKHYIPKVSEWMSYLEFGVHFPIDIISSIVVSSQISLPSHLILSTASSCVSYNYCFNCKIGPLVDLKQIIRFREH